MKRTKLKPRSKKTETIYRTQRRALVANMLQDNTPCARCNRAQATEVHEIKTRARGGSITNPENCVPLCHNCHHWITTNPKQAHIDGWLKHSWEQ